MSSTITSNPSSQDVREMIAQVYVCVFNAPAPSTWGKKYKQGGLVARISKLLNLSTGSSRSVRRVMLITWKAWIARKVPDLSHSPPADTTFKIEEGSKYEKMVCELLEHGNSVRITSEIVSRQMCLDNVPTFSSTSPVLSVIKRLNPIQNQFSKMNQASDSHSAWVKARYNWCLHLLVRLGRSDDVAEHLSSDSSVLPLWLDQETLSTQGYTFDVHQIAHFDEVHVKQKYGGHGKFQLRFKRNEVGELIKNENDTYQGISASSSSASSYGPEHFRRVFKFEEEARMMLGVSMIQVQVQDRFVSKGIRLPLFDYTGKKIIGMGKWNKLVRMVIKDVRKNGSAYWVSKVPRPSGMEIFELDDLLNVPHIGKKTALLLNEIGLFTVKDCMDIDDLNNSFEYLPVSETRRNQIANIINHAVSNANPGKSTLSVSLLFLFRMA